jgi:acetolactate synthase, small subunit
MQHVQPPFAGPPMKSHYSDAPAAEPIARHTLAVIVDNEPGVLARIAGLFSGRGYNIESLTVSETEHEKHLSRITIVTTGTANVIEQIKAQLSAPGACAPGERSDGERRRDRARAGAGQGGGQG